MPQLPPEFITRIKKQFPSEAEEMLAALDSPASVSVLVNRAKMTTEEWPGQTVPWLVSGRILDQRPSFALDPLWHCGAYYSQESSSMFLGHVLRACGVPSDGLLLDLCAAPGGKSLVISDFMEDSGLLVSNEMHPLRAAILKENIIKHGRPNIAVTRNTPEELTRMGPVFDAVLVDAPCSGEGMFRKDPDARAEWNPGLAAMCAARQEDILRSAVQTIRPGGVLLYSTCTFASDENEDIIRFLQSEFGLEPIHISAPTDWPVQRAGGGFRFAPHISPGEGLFMAALRKPQEQQKHRKKPYDALSRIKPIALPVEVAGLANPVFFTRPKQTEIWACRSEHFETVNALAAAARVIHFPLEVGEIKGRDLVPAHHLAMCGAAPKSELTEAQALDYLRKNEITVDGPKGWLLVGYRGRALGWLKNLGNRSNNYYPKEYRLRIVSN